MQCPKCNIPVKSYFTYCPNCGANLQSRFGTPVIRGFILILLIGSLAAGYLVFFRPAGDRLAFREDAPSVRAAGSVKAQESDGSETVSGPLSSPSPEVQVPVGTLIFYDIAGNEWGRMPVAVSRSGWVAVPARSGIGGYRWQVVFPGDNSMDIDGAIMGDRDAIGLWQAGQVAGVSGTAGPSVFPAEPGADILWVSLVSDRRRNMTGMTLIEEQQNVDQVIFEEKIHEPGVLFQHRHLVGWTFGDSTAGAYLWKGPDESNLVCEFSVRDFYRHTFAGSREEKFIQAHALTDGPSGSPPDMQPAEQPVEQLAAFAEGFRRPAVLFSDNTPALLTTAAVVEKMRNLITLLVADGRLYSVLPLLDSQVLSATRDAEFLMDVLAFGLDVAGPETVAETLQNVLVSAEHFSEKEQRRIREFQQSVYVQWLEQMISASDEERGFLIFHEARSVCGDAPEILLRGIRLALAVKDWRTAENILTSGRFPMIYQDRIAALQARIAALKSQQDKIVVPFTPGSSRVAAAATLNHQVDVEFLVDTGASMVTIPREAARRLGFHITGTTPTERLVTAGGVIQASRIMLEAITIDGWTEFKIPAYVVDIPQQAGLGLLGLNFLNRFRMDLDTDAGMLILAPR